MAGEIEISEIPKELLKSDIWADFTENMETIRELLEVSRHHCGKTYFIYI